MPLPLPLLPLLLLLASSSLLLSSLEREVVAGESLSLLLPTEDCVIVTEKKSFVISSNPSRSFRGFVYTM
jgi:hypothetical protein